MPICFNCSRVTLEDFKYCPECGEEANADYNCIYECVKGNIGRTPIHSIMAYCKISREQTAFLLKKLKSIGYVAGNDRSGYWLTPVGARIFKKIEPNQKENIETEIKQVFEYLSEHKNTSISQISKELNLSILTIRDAIKKLKERGKITLL